MPTTNLRVNLIHPGDDPDGLYWNGDDYQDRTCDVLDGSLQIAWGNGSYDAQRDASTCALVLATNDVRDDPPIGTYLHVWVRQEEEDLPQVMPLTIVHLFRGFVTDVAVELDESRNRFVSVLAVDPFGVANDVLIGDSVWPSTGANTRFTTITDLIDTETGWPWSWRWMGSINPTVTALDVDKRRGAELLNALADDIDHWAWYDPGWYCPIPGGSYNQIGCWAMASKESDDTLYHVSAAPEIELSPRAYQSKAGVINQIRLEYGYELSDVNGVIWNYRTSAPTGDPGSGNIEYASGAMAVSRYSKTSIDMAVWLRRLRVGSLFYAQEQANADNRAVYRITTEPADNGTWYTWTTEVVESTGTGPSNNADVAVNFEASAKPAVYVEDTASIGRHTPRYWYRTAGLKEEADAQVVADQMLARTAYAYLQMDGVRFSIPSPVDGQSPMITLDDMPLWVALARMQHPRSRITTCSPLFPHIAEPWWVARGRLTLWADQWDVELDTRRVDKWVAHPDGWTSPEIMWADPTRKWNGRDV